MRGSSVKTDKETSEGGWRRAKKCPSQITNVGGYVFIEGTATHAPRWPQEQPSSSRSNPRPWSPSPRCDDISPIEPHAQRRRGGRWQPEARLQRLQPYLYLIRLRSNSFFLFAFACSRGRETTVRSSSDRRFASVTDVRRPVGVLLSFENDSRNTHGVGVSRDGVESE